MALALYMDVHVPSAVTEGLRRRGVDVLTSQEDGTREAKDEALLLRATARLKTLLITSPHSATPQTSSPTDSARPGFVGR